METRQTLSTRELAGFDEPEAQTRTDTDTDRDRNTETEAVVEERLDENVDARDARTTRTDETPELFPREENADFQGRWETIQTGFVDDPRRTVEQADELVANVMQRLAEGFAAERERLEQQWGRGEDVSTEDLRIALQRYRGFFQRLLQA